MGIYVARKNHQNHDLQEKEKKVADWTFSKEQNSEAQVSKGIDEPHPQAAGEFLRNQHQEYVSQCLSRSEVQ